MRPDPGGPRQGQVVGFAVRRMWSIRSVRSSVCHPRARWTSGPGASDDDNGCTAAGDNHDYDSQWAAWDGSNHHRHPSSRRGHFDRFDTDSRDSNGRRTDGWDINGRRTGGWDINGRSTGWELDNPNSNFGRWSFVPESNLHMHLFEW